MVEIALLVQMTNSLMSTKQVIPALKAGVYMLPVRPLNLQFAPRRNANERREQPAVLIVHQLCFHAVAQFLLRRCLGSTLADLLGCEFRRAASNHLPDYPMVCSTLTG